MPIEPVDELPELFVAGFPAQVEIVTRDPVGRPEVLELIGPLPAGTSSAPIGELSGSGASADPFPATLELDDHRLDDVAIEARLANVPTPLRAELTGGVRRVLKDGPLIRESRYWSRFSNSQFTWGGVHAYVERRVDVDVILVTLVVSNGVCHPGAGQPTLDDPAAYVSENPTVDGDTWLDSLRIIRLPQDWVVRTAVERDSMDCAQGYLLRPYDDPDQQHFLPSRSAFKRRLALCHVSNIAAADDLLALRGFGRAEGRNSYHARQAWGTAKDRLPVVTQTLEHKGTKGLDAARSLRMEQLDEILPAYRAGSAEPTGGTDVGLRVGSAGGWQHPLGNSSGSIGSSLYIGTTGWPFLVREEMLLALAMHESNLERMPVALIHPTTGDAVTAHDLAAANQVPGHEGEQPWDIKATQGRRPGFDVAWMVAEYATEAALDPEDKLLPTDRPWNAPDPRHDCPYRSRLMWQMGEGGGRYSRYDDQHLSRYLFTLRPGIWHLNDSATKDLALWIGAYAQCAQTPYRVHRVRSGSSGSLLDARDEAAQEPHDGNGFARASAWLTEANTIAHAVASPAWRTDNALYWSTLAEWIDLQASPVTRTTQRIHYPTNNSPDPFKAYDPTNFGLKTGNLPEAFGFAQTFEMFFVQHAAWGAVQTVFEGHDPLQAGRLRSIVDGMTASIFAPQETTPGSFVYDHETIGALPSKFLVVATDPSAPPLDVLEPWAFVGTGGTQQHLAFPGWLTSRDAFFALSNAYQSTGDRFYLDRAAQALGFDPTDYVDSEVADEVISRLDGDINNSSALFMTGLAAHFQ